jgi:hypothetical protein
MGSCCTTAEYFPLLDLPDDILCFIMPKTLCIKELALVCRRFARLASRYLVDKPHVAYYTCTRAMGDGYTFTFNMNNTCSDIPYWWGCRPIRGLCNKNGRENIIQAGLLNGRNVIVDVPKGPHGVPKGLLVTKGPLVPKGLLVDLDEIKIDGVVNSVVKTTWDMLQIDQRAAIIMELKNGSTMKWGVAYSNLTHNDFRNVPQLLVLRVACVK